MVVRPAGSVGGLRGGCETGDDGDDNWVEVGAFEDEVAGILPRWLNSVASSPSTLSSFRFLHVDAATFEFFASSDQHPFV